MRPHHPALDVQLAVPSGPSRSFNCQDGCLIEFFDVVLLLQVCGRHEERGRISEASDWVWFMGEGRIRNRDPQSRDSRFFSHNSSSVQAQMALPRNILQFRALAASATLPNRT